ncbi:MAG TPA: PAS domain S-box protein [Ktedonobacterales bacterium]|nr:PAS domain S-box protein [Ktedonobacterales bacterium]
MSLNIEQFAVTLLQSMSDAVVYADVNGRIQYWNTAAERMFGYSAADALNQSLDIIIPVSLRGRHWAGYNKTMQTGATRYGAGDLLSVPAIRKDGLRISVEFTIVPFLNESGKLLGIAAIMRDVTRRFEEMKALRLRAAAASST